MVWLLPFLARQPQHALASKLNAKFGDSVGYYGQAGGNLRPFYPDID
jgi:poly(beta-D-mannuronate) lyase